MVSSAADIANVFHVKSRRLFLLLWFEANTALGLGADKQTVPERTLEVYCLHCGAKFVAYYGRDEENVERVEVQKCGLCHGESFRQDNFKGAMISLVAEVTSRRWYTLGRRATSEISSDNGLGAPHR